MLQEVIERRPSYNNHTSISSNSSISKLKQFYYQIFTRLYSHVGSFASLVMVNSSWTESHISKLWNLSVISSTDYHIKSSLYKVFPPCNTSHLDSIPIVETSRRRIILSIGQFRPEKDHLLQLRYLHVGYLT